MGCSQQSEETEAPVCRTGVRSQAPAWAAVGVGFIAPTAVKLSAIAGTDWALLPARLFPSGHALDSTLPFLNMGCLMVLLFSVLQAWVLSPRSFSTILFLGLVFSSFVWCLLNRGEPPLLQELELRVMILLLALWSLAVAVVVEVFVRGLNREYCWSALGIVAVLLTAWCDLGYIEVFGIT